MKQIAFIIIGGAIVLVQPVWCQSDTLSHPCWELSGTLFFSAETQTDRPGFRGVDYKTYTWALQPGIGIFLGERTELSFDVQFQESRHQIEWSDQSGGTITNYAGTLRVAVGPGYNLPITSRFWTFLHLKLGLSWTHEGYNSSYFTDSYCSESRIVFPIIQGGAKYFVGTGCAVIVGIQYDRISYDRQSTFTVGVGLAAYM